ncbi:MAG: DNA methyltransferase [Coleofasciculus sp. A1-SPW-01]|uniref:DNA methyltransferase n=1 Tax=Coleofasciculus sp. A1-SPW-01 TaxID=3070819 RepID=UPI0033021ED7
MKVTSTNPLSLSTATGRWSGLGPYYAMFPREFAFNVIETYSKPGDAVLDPFAGRATSIYAAAAMQRLGCGIEINAVGWLYGHVKLKPALQRNVLRRINNIGEIAKSIDSKKIDGLPEFFLVCYCPDVLRYLVVARDELRWKNSIVDATLMAIILVHLHGRREQSLSNQMRQGKSMAPDYSVRWWKDRQLTPPDVDPVEFLIQRLQWRYRHGIPNLSKNGTVIRGNSISLLSRIKKKVSNGEKKPFDLLFTSPPYYKLTNYHYDQWLRLWMLGGPNQPTWISEKWKNRFESKSAYCDLLYRVFRGCAEIMASTSIVYVRTDAREFTKTTTLEILRDVFPNKSLEIVSKPFIKNTQTALFGDKSKKPGEIDIIMR